MSAFPDPSEHDGLALAALVRGGEVSAVELLDDAIARIEADNPRLNAVVRTRYEAARVEATRVDPAAPFAGVPFLVKDLLCTLAGEPTGQGNRLLQQRPMPQDSELVRRFRRAGLVIAGRTNTPEFGLTPTTEPLVHGPTHNPWSLAHSPGGSSGGSAAAVAAGWVPLASGGDGGGSIRIPASCCGLFGFKPSRGTTPTGPVLGELWNGLAIEHALTRSVRDSAALLLATHGADPGAPYAAPALPDDLLQRLERDPAAPLRIGYTARPLFGQGPVHTDCVTALHDAATLLQQLGHAVEDAAPPLEPEADALAFVTVLAAQTRAETEHLARLLGRPPRPADVEPATYSLGLAGLSLTAAAYAAALQQLQGAARRLAPYFERFDLLLTPTLAAPPARTGALQPSAAERWQIRVVNALQAPALLRATGAVRTVAGKTFAYMPYTALFNATGQPAMSVPLHWNAEGMPVGVQVVGRLGDDARLLQLAAQLERARPWARRRPPVPAPHAG